MNLIVKASSFALEAHKGQKRKYTGKDYIEHPVRVANSIAKHELKSKELIAAAYLHDVVEDCDVNPSVILKEFGPLVAYFVMGVTNPSKIIPSHTMYRHRRKKIDFLHVKSFGRECCVLKLIDRLDNLNELEYKYNPGFVDKYITESYMLIDIIGKFDINIFNQIIDRIQYLKESKDD